MYGFRSGILYGLPWASGIFISLSDGVEWLVCVWCVCVHAQLCPILCNPLPGSSVLGIFQARILEQVAISYSGTSFWPMSLAFPPLARESFYHCHLGHPIEWLTQFIGHLKRYLIDDLQVNYMCSSGQRSANLCLKGQVANILGSVSQKVSAETTQLCSQNMK